MQKFSNSTNIQNEDDEIEEDIKYEGKFEILADQEENNDEFIESISKSLIILFFSRA